MEPIVGEMNVKVAPSNVRARKEIARPQALTEARREWPHCRTSTSATNKHVSDHIPQKMEMRRECNIGGRVLETAQEIAGGEGTRKCVYNYEDKYSFERILVPESLVFDSHFESGNLYSAFRVWPAEPHTILPEK